MKFAIAAGGTGGHIFPGLSLAEEIKTRDENHEIIFIGTKLGMEAVLIPQYGYPLRVLWGKRLKQGSIFSRVLTLITLPLSFLQSLWILLVERPQCIIGIGGYASGPFLLMATLLRRVTAIIEPNSIPGMTNRILSRFVNKIFIAFTKAGESFPAHKTLQLGNPVRSEIIKVGASDVLDNPGHFHILILGGSQGARQINQAVIESLPLLERNKAKITIQHQTGANDCEWVNRYYEEHRWEAQATPFIKDLGLAYAKADLVISRAGASTISELIACGKPSILIPYPHAADDHQRYNAEFIVEQGAALMLAGLDVTPGNLAENILDFINHPENLDIMREKIAEIPGREATQKIVDHCFELIKARAA
jgi:UDP-N-acetylglucosamine--N-acetylmuramyl-(pentapeptide) pyrophosphoryl-undecaprenol N-acetylglucosamine transferase